MKQNRFETILALCLNRIEQGDSIANCLADYPTEAEKLKELLQLRTTLTKMHAPQPSLIRMGKDRQQLLTAIKQKKEKPSWNETLSFLWQKTIQPALTLAIFLFGISWLLQLQQSTTDIVDTTPAALLQAPAITTGTLPLPSPITSLETAETAAMSIPTRTPTPSISNNTPLIHSFTISPAHLMPNQRSVTLSWSTNAQTVYLHALSKRGDLSTTLYQGAGTDQFTYQDEYRPLTELSGFLIFAYTNEKYLQAELQIHCHPDAWFFPSPPHNCPTTPITSYLMKQQQFTNGLYIQIPNQGAFLLYQNEHLHLWSDEITEPVNQLKETPTYNNTQQTIPYLGQPTSSLKQFDGYYQCSNEWQQKCFLTDADGTIYKLFFDKRWEAMNNQ